MPRLGSIRSSVKRVQYRRIVWKYIWKSFHQALSNCYYHILAEYWSLFSFMRVKQHISRLQRTELKSGCHTGEGLLNKCIHTTCCYSDFPLHSLQDARIRLIPSRKEAGGNFSGESDHFERKKPVNTNTGIWDGPTRKPYTEVRGTSFHTHRAFWCPILKYELFGEST